jgi:thymidylate synthase (FAD)
VGCQTMEEDDGAHFVNGLIAPKIFVIARPKVDWAAVFDFEKQEATWRRDIGATDAEQLVELAGRVCYLSFGDRQSAKSNADYIANLIERGHDSVLEHASWTLILTGVSRAFTHQLVRHRVGFSYSQLSQQYHTEESARFIEPSSISRDAQQQAAWREAVLSAHQAYRKFLSDVDIGSPSLEGLNRRESQRAHRSAARGLLPAATETKIAISANARAIRHFLSVRGEIAGDEEMRVVSARLLEAVQADAPALFADFTVDELLDGSPIVRRRTQRTTIGVAANARAIREFLAVHGGVVGSAEEAGAFAAALAAIVATSRDIRPDVDEATVLRRMNEHYKARSRDARH